MKVHVKGHFRCKMLNRNPQSTRDSIFEEPAACPHGTETQPILVLDGWEATMCVESGRADLRVGKFPNCLDETGVWRGEGVYCDGDGAEEECWDVLQCVHIVC